jgi:hypothetical protein
MWICETRGRLAWTDLMSWYGPITVLDLNDRPAPRLR